MSKKFIFLFLLFNAHPIFARTLSQLQSDTRSLVSDANSNRQLFTNQQITDFLNAGQKFAINQTWCLAQNVQFQLSIGTTYYAVPNDFLAINRLTLNGLILNQESPAALDSKSEGWQLSSGIPTYYFIDFSSSNYVGFTPVPVDSTSTGTISMDYYQQPTDMVNPTDEPFNGVTSMQGYGYILPYYAASQMSAIEQQSSLTSFYMQMYSQAVTLLGQKCRNNPNYLPSFSAHE